MVKDIIIESLQQRRTSLMAKLEEGAIDLETQHQLYGAVNEIDVFLETLQQEEIRDESIGPVTLIKPNMDDDTISKFKSLFRR